MLFNFCDIAMADINAIASEFVNFYYRAFDSDRPSLRVLYRDYSMLTFEGQSCQGSGNIVEKLTNLAFTNVVHLVDSTDAQPSHPEAGHILVHVIYIDVGNRTIKSRWRQ